MNQPDKQTAAGRYARAGHPAIGELVAEQGTRFPADPAELLGDFWPPDESVDDFLRSLDELRGHNRRDRAA